MALRLSPPVQRTFRLERTDEEFGISADATGTHVTIRQASQAQHEKRSDLYANMTSRLLGDQSTVEIVSRFSFPELQRIEAMLTLAGCNIEDEDGQPLFRFKDDRLAMTNAEFVEAWGKLPTLVADEIHAKVIEVNPTWGRLGEGQ